MSFQFPANGSYEYMPKGSSAFDELSSIFQPVSHSVAPSMRPSFVGLVAACLSATFISPVIGQRGDDYRDDEPRRAGSQGDSRGWQPGQPVRTSSGTIYGQPGKYRRDVSEYLGIRYAQPPVGRLRFAAPQKYRADGYVNATTYVSSLLVFALFCLLTCTVSVRAITVLSMETLSNVLMQRLSVYNISLL
jgi:hypothetical protein